MEMSNANQAADEILQLDDPRATLATVGGKGANLALLARAGLLVPNACFVTTAAYRSFVEANGLDAVIAAALDGLDAGAPEALEAASATIRTAFGAGSVPRPILSAFTAAYGDLEGRAVAVRSSATAEDLPELSFAGQQDTYLNVVGALALRRAIIDCWSSLWTARAIGYRARNGIDQASVALAVVVQEMVESEVSGVLFTANPLTGLRDETVIDATFGLGEALVSGQVEPDHYVVESATGRLRSRVLGAKALSIRSTEGGGVAHAAEDAATLQALSNGVIAELTQLGQRIEALYGGVPQDIEWAWADGKLYVLQSRPITSLFPLPETIPPGEFALLFSFGSVQGISDPITPMGQEFIRHASAGLARLFGYDFAPGQVPAIHFAAERMWIRFDTLLRNKLSRRIWRAFFHQVDASAAPILDKLLEDPRTQPTRAIPTGPVLRRIARVLRLFAPRIADAARRPDAARVELARRVDTDMARFTAQAAAAHTLADRVRTSEQIFAALFPTFIEIAPRVLPGLLAFNRLLELAQRVGMPRSEALEVVRSLPHNVTSEMNLALWQTAVAIRSNEEARTQLQSADAKALAAQYLDGALPAAAQEALDAFLRDYGARGVAEIDMGRPRWRDDPTQVLQMVQNYLAITDEAQTPDAVYRRGAAAAQQAQEKLVAAVEKKFGAREAALARAYVVRLRALAGLRELPKFSVIRVLGIVRAMLQEGFKKLAEAGVLEAADDGFFLTLNELRAVDAGFAIDWKALVRERRALWAHEARRKQLPLLLVSDGRTYYAGAVDVPADGATQSDGVLDWKPRLSGCGGGHRPDRHAAGGRGLAAGRDSRLPGHGSGVDTPLSFGGRPGDGSGRHDDARVGGGPRVWYSGRGGRYKRHAPPAKRAARACGWIDRAHYRS